MDNELIQRCILDFSDVGLLTSQMDGTDAALVR